MIKRTKTPEGIKVTFSLVTDTPVSVVGDFNDWNPYAHPLKPRGKGVRSVSELFAPGSRVVFRYLEHGGRFLDDPDADAIEDNGCGATHGVLEITASRPAAKRGRSSKTAPTKTS
jgi:hypothetical protein